MKIALFLDGTWNRMLSDEAETDTNVVRLYRGTVNDGVNQITEYFSGIGRPQSNTAIDDDSISYPAHRALGGRYGLGMSDHVKEAYQFLSRTYRPCDHVYLFGFSRGAFAARALAGFADAVGLLLADQAKSDLIEQAYAFYENAEDPRLTALRGFLHDMTGRDGPRGEQTLPIYFIGVWDTVGALGFSGFLKRITAPFTEFYRTELPANVTHARHALALHENRKLFPPLLWKRRSPENPQQTLEQRWFNGAHSDVGGGYKEREWSDLALNWMAREASGFDLALNDKWEFKPDVTKEKPIHNAWKGWFTWTPFGMREKFAVYPNPPEEIHETFTVDPSVPSRLYAVPSYDFPEEINEAIAKMDAKALQLHLSIEHQRGEGRRDHK